MTTQERNDILETVDLLKAMGGQNGFANFQPKFKKTLLSYAHKLEAIVSKDIKIKNSITEEEFTGEVIYE